MSQYFPKPYDPFSGDINVKVDLSNYATKANIKNITHVDTSSFALKTNLANLKSEVDKLDVDKLKFVPTDLSKLSDVVKNDVVKKTDYNKLVTKVYNIDTSGLAKKTDYNTKITEIEDKIPDTSNLATKILVNKVENRIPDISNLATKIALTTVENKIPDISSLVKKSDYNTTITGIENNIKKLEKYDLSYFRGKQYFDEGDGKQNYLVFLSMRKYFKLNSVVNVIDRVLSWRSKEISNESIKPPTTSDNSLTPKLNYNNNTKIRVQFTGSCLKQPKFTFTHKKVVNIYIVYELSASSSHISDHTINNCLFGAVTLTKKADIEKYRYSGYGIGFDRISSFSFPSGVFGQNLLIFGADMSSFIHIDNNKKDILVLGRGPTQGLESTLNAEKMYSINFTVTKKKCYLSLHYNRANSYLFVNGTEIIKFKAKDSEIVASPLCLGNKKYEKTMVLLVMILVRIIMLLQLMVLKIFMII